MLGNIISKRSGRFNFISFDANRKRSLDRIDGNHQSLVTIAREKNAFHAIESAAANAHSLTDLEKRVSGLGQSSFDQIANRLDLCIRNRRTFAPGANQTEYSIDAKRS